MSGPAYRAAIAAEIYDKLPALITGARSIDWQRWEIVVDPPRKRIRAAEIQRLEKRCLNQLKKGWYRSRRT
jgi:hypothetical protein